MVMRRAAVLLIALAADIGLAWLLWRVLAPGGWTAAKLTMAAAFAGTAPWTGLCAANGIIGLVLSVFRPPFAPLSRVEADSWSLPRTAIAVTVRDEDMGRVLPALRRLLHGLDLAGSPNRVSLTLRATGRNDRQAPRQQEVSSVAVLHLDGVAGLAEVIHLCSQNQFHLFKSFLQSCKLSASRS